MQQVSLKSLYQQGHFDSISTLRKNSSGYPFITLLKSGETTKANNMYFGRNSASLINDNFEPGNSVIEILKDASVILTENKEGEKRFKISINKPGSKYESSAALEDVFGVQEKNVDFEF